MVDDTVEWLRFGQAVLEWSPGRLVENVRSSERYFTAESITSMGRLHLGGAAETARKARDNGIATSMPREHLESAWTAVIEDFRRRVDDGELYLSGVLVAPEERQDREPIASVWVSVLDIDPHRSIVRGMGRRWTAVRLSRTPYVAAPPASAPLTKITPECVAGLPDETLLALVEEYGRRIAEDPGNNFPLPGKLSFMPLIHRRMQWRARHGELQPTLASEAQALAEWISTKVTTHQLPSASAIENALRDDYRALKP